MDAVALDVVGYRAAVLALVRPLPVERVPLLEGLGRLAAEPAHALHPVPLFDNAAMDGYAVRAADVGAAAPEHPARLRVVDRAPAGHGRPAPIGPGEAVRIMTGAPVPAGADLVVPVEATVAGRFVDDAAVELWGVAKANIRVAGEDLPAGAPLLAAGVPLTARGLALLAATGHRTVAVRRRPRVAVLSSGDELSDSPDAGSGTVADSNGVYLCAAVRSLGGVVTRVLRAGDEADALDAALDDASRDADLIVSTGGLGAGSHDLIGRTAARTRSGMLARVAMRPGRPQACGTWRGVPWIALPGTPTAAVVAFESFVRPALERMQGAAAAEATGAETVSVGWPGVAGAVRFVPLAVTEHPDGVTVAPLGTPSRGAHALAAMYSAPLIGVVGAEVGDVVAGRLLPVIAPA